MFHKNHFKIHPKTSPNKKFTKFTNVEDNLHNSSQNSDQFSNQNSTENNSKSSTNSPDFTNLDSNQPSSSSNSNFNSPSKFRSGNFRRPKAPLIKEKKQIPSRILNEKQFLFSKVASFLLIIAILIFGSSFYLWQNQNSQNSNNLVQNYSNSSSLSSSNFSNLIANSESSSSNYSSSSSSSSSAKTILVDNKGAKISEFVKKNANIDMGTLSYQTLEELKIKPPIDVSKIEQSFFQENSNQLTQNSNSNPNTNSGQNSEQSTKPAKILEEIIPKPKELESKESEPKTNLDKKNLLVFPKYKIEVPIIHLTFDQMYPRNKNGEIDFNGELNYPLDRPVCQQAVYRDTCHPVQKALELGAVHLPMSVHPGEIGTSYIAAHTSNWGFVKSPYNAIFKPMEGQTKVGDEFFVFDNWGRKLKFRIFDSLEIRADDLTNAYKKFDNRRTITLQGSVLKWTKQGLQPTHRWLSRGELVEESVSNSSNSTN